MKVAIKSITQENLDDIPEPCRVCLYWEFPEEFEKLQQKSRLAEEKKREWFIETLKGFGDCGKIVYLDEVPVGYAQYAPLSCLPQASSYKTKRLQGLEEGTVFLSCLYVSNEKHRGKGMGMKLLKSIITDLRDRGFKAVEAFARRGSSNNPSGPVELYLKSGFRIEDETDPEFPLVRLELWQ
ncbi:MAG: GNAT family N-acetyltransferase [Candidatus Bathyarchaeia archaeon]